MALPASPAFKAAQSAPSAEPRYSLLAILTDVAESSQGTTATATDEFSSDFPAAGAIDGKLDHLDFGPAATAEDLQGKGGWKSGSAAMSLIRTTAADWTAGVQDAVRTFGAQSEMMMRITPTYTQDFNGLTPGDLGGQDSWIKFSSLGGNAIVQSTVALEGSQSLRFDTDPGVGPKQSVYRRTFSDPLDYSWRFRHRRTTTIDGTSVSYQGVIPSGAVAWTWTIMPNDPLNQLFFSAIGVHFQPIDTSDHDYEIRLLSGSLTLWIDGILTFTTTPVVSGGLRRIDLSVSRGSGTSGEIIGYSDLFVMESLRGFYEQDFNGLADGALATQDGWVQVSGTATINIASSGLPSGMEGKAIRLIGDSVTGRRISKLFNAGTAAAGMLTLKRNRTILGTSGVPANTYFRLVLRDSVGLADRYEIRSTAETTAALYAGPAGTPTRVQAMSSQMIGVTGRTTIDWSAAAAGATVRFWVNGQQIDEQIVDMTGVNTVVLEIVRVAGATDPELWIEELRIGGFLSAEGTQDNILDLGAAPSSARAEITVNAEVNPVSRYAAGAFYGANNNDASRALRRTSAPIGLLLAQTFEVSSISQLDAVLIGLIRTGTIPEGNVWLELRDTSAGAPTSPVLARSRLVMCSAISTSTTAEPIRFEWPKPWVLQAARRYALVLNGDYAQSNTINVSLRVDASAPGYASGQVYDTADGTTWAAQTEDAGFIVLQTHQVETFYDATNRDGSRTLGGSASDYVVGQSFKVPHDRDIRHFQFLLRKHESATFAAGTRFRIELHGDDGTGKSSGTVLVRGVEYDPALVTWGGTEAAQVFELFTASLSRPYRALAGTSYVVVLVPDWAASATNHLDVGTDESSATYADGVLSVGTSASPAVWTVQTGKDAIFALLEGLTPTPLVEVAYSSDGISFGAFSRVTDNPDRKSVIGPVSFTGEALRYWKVRARLLRLSSPGIDRPIGTAVFDYTLKLIFGSSKSLTVAFGQARTVSRVEIIAHPLEAGVRSCKLQTSPNGTTYSDVTAYARVEARKRGGGATASSVGAVITTDGDYLALDLAADVTGTTHLRLIVLDNVDEWARVIEFRAFRAVDFGRRVLADPSVVAQADFVQRRFRAKQFSVQLDNTDGFLSPLGNLGGFNSELGEGTRLVFRTGYQGTEELKHGEFWVDNWVENPQTATVAVQARDLAKLADVSVTVRYKTDRRSWELIEYLMNLANIPSQWMTLDRTSTRIKHFAPTEPNAWQEAQKVAEAASFAQLYVDRDGYLRFRASGMSCGDTGITSASGLVSPVWVLGRPTIHDDGKIYLIIADNDAPGAITYKFMRFDPDPGTWVQIASLPSSVGASYDGHLWSAEGYVWLALVIGVPTVSLVRRYLYRWDGTILLLVADHSHLVNPAENNGLNNPIVHLEPGWAFIGGPIPAANQSGLFAYDLLTYERRVLQADFGAASASHGINALLSESGKRLAFCGHRFTATETVEATRLFEWNPWTSVFTRVLSFDPTFQGSAGGASATGKGYVYAINDGQFGGTPPGDFPARIRKIDVPSYTVTDLDQLDTISRRAGGEAGRMAYADGMVVLAHIRTPSNVDARMERRLAIHDEDTARSISAGTLTMSASLAKSFVPFTFSGQNFVMGVYDRTKVFEMQIRRSTPLQDVPVVTLTSQPGGLLMGASLDHGTDKGGDNRITNLGIFKAQPLIDLPTETLWTADRLPWAANPGPGGSGSRLRFKVQLKDPGINLLASIATSPGGIATVTLDDGASNPDAIQPTVLVNITGEGLITGLSITGRPLRKSGTLVVAVVGSGKSLARFGVRSLTVQNDYVYDTFSAAPGAAWLVLNNQARKTKVDGLQAMALLDLELLDLIRLTDDRTGLNELFYTTGFRHGYGSQRSSLTVVQRIGNL